MESLKVEKGESKLSTLSGIIESGGKRKGF
jgi:hypothetical protein